MRQNLLKTLFFVGMTGLSACAVDDGPGIVIKESPFEILEFKTTTDTVVAGEEITAAWHVSGADRIELQVKPDLGQAQTIPIYDGEGELSFNPTANTEFVLLATKGADRLLSRQSVSLDAGVEASQSTEAPRFGELSGEVDANIKVSLTASSTCVRSGSTIRLDWSVDGANEIEFQPITVNVEPDNFEGHKIIPIGESRTIKLLAYNRVTGGQNSASVQINADPINYQTSIKPVLVKAHTQIVMDPEEEGRFYLIAGKELFQVDHGDLQSIFTAPLDLTALAVTMDSEGTRTVYAAYKGTVRKKKDGDSSWGYVPVRYNGTSLDILSMAANRDDVMIATVYGIYRYKDLQDDGGKLTVSKLISGIKLVVALPNGFLASANSQVLYNLSGDYWSSRDLPNHATAHHFFENANTVFVVSEDGQAFELVGSGWTRVEGPTSGVKAVDIMKDGELAFMTGGKIYIQLDGTSDWYDSVLSGAVPAQVKGQASDGEKNYFWDGNSLYEWSAALAPLTCR